MKIVFFGTPQFAADVLRYLLDNKIDVAAVITKPDKPQGRSGKLVPTPVKQVAEEYGIPYHQPLIVSDLAFAPTLESYQADLFVVVAYGEMLKQHILEMPEKGCINVHPSLLPKYRGASPIQHSVIHGDSETGVTIMHMVKKMDAGDMIDVVKISLDPNITYGELEKVLCRAGSELLLKVIDAFEIGPVSAVVQDHDKATFVKKIELEDCELRWDKPGLELHNLVRGVNPEPGAWCYIQVKGNKLRLKVMRTEYLADRSGTPGEIIGYGKEGFIVACGTGAVKILELQLEGKKAMPVADFMRGQPRDNLKL